MWLLPFAAAATASGECIVESALSARALAESAGAHTSPTSGASPAIADAGKFTISSGATSSTIQGMSVRRSATTSPYSPEAAQRAESPDARPINAAAHAGDLPALKNLVAKGTSLRPDPAARDYGVIPVARAMLGLKEALEGARPDREAMARRYVSVLRYLLENGADPNARDSGWAPLARAAQLPVFADRREVIALLLSHGAQADAHVLSGGVGYAAAIGNDDWLAAMPLEKLPNEAKHGSLAAFARLGRYDLAGRMIAIGADVHAAYATNEGPRPLIGMLPELAPEAQARLLEFYLRHGGDLNRPMTHDGTTMLMRALPDPRLVALLLEAGANPNLSDKAGYTPLYATLDPRYRRPSNPTEPHDWWHRPVFATPEGRLANATALLGKRADPNVVHRGYTALMHAGPKEAALVDALFAAGGRIVPGADELSQYFYKGKPYLGPVSWAVVKGHRDLPLRLLKRDGFSKAADCGLAFYAALFDHAAVLDQALRGGADLKLRDFRGGDDMFHAAIAADSAEAVAWMLDHRLASVNAREGIALRPPIPHGRGDNLVEGLSTPLMYAALVGAGKVVDVLLARGADPDARDLHGRSALYYASRRESRDGIAERLRAAGAR